MIDPDCHYGDHTWNGTSACIRCGKRLRCSCGCYVREDNLEKHVKTCRYIEAEMRQEREQIESTFGG